MKKKEFYNIDTWTPTYMEDASVNHKIVR